MLRTPIPTCHDAMALRAGVLGSVLGIALLKAFALSTTATGSLMGVGLWMLACLLLGAWALAAYLTCLALSRRVFVLMLTLLTVLIICVA